MTSATMSFWNSTNSSWRASPAATGRRIRIFCDPSLTAFEPEGRGHLIQGLEFHRFYFELGPSEGPRTTTMSSPKVRLMGDVAVVSYVRLVQSMEGGTPVTSHFEETRVWQMQQGRWQHVHFHRSPC